MAAFTKLNLRHDVEDMAPKFGLDGVESHFARVPLELERSGVSYFNLAPDFRFPFGHEHAEQEEIYVVISGAATLALDDEEIALERLDAVRIPAGSKRNVQAGAEGAELIAFGAPNTENKDAEMIPGWWGGD
jgi:mannose-6-phosphate isomerase-like protein (cupin superfamily)